MNTSTKILNAIQKCEEELRGQNRYPAIPVIIESLKRMLEELNNPDSNYEKKSKMVGAIGRIITDDFNLMKSDIGKAVADATNEFLK